jgi:LysR family cys regulon transcriptional activator
VAALRQAYPKVAISLHQGSPDQVAKMLMEEVAEIGMATESLVNYPELVTLPCYEWQHVLVFPFDHPLLERERITHEDLAQVPLITYHPSYTGRTRIDQAFALRHLQPNIVLEAIDSDVIKTYVKLGMGVGIVAEMAMAGDNQTPDLVSRPAADLFGHNLARVAFKRGTYLRHFVLRFAELLSERLTRDQVMRAMSGTPDDYEL